MKIGVFGVGIELEGLVNKKNYEATLYLDPVKKANEIASQLKNDHKCDLVICLSHLGYKYNQDKVSDQILASNTRYIDLIIGGHTHTFMEAPEDRQNMDGKITLINQVGWAGINLGRIDYFFQKGKANKKLFGNVNEYYCQFDKKLSMSNLELPHPKLMYAQATQRPHRQPMESYRKDN